MATYVLIHGSFQGGWIWSPTAQVLRAKGHQVLTPTLDGCAQRKIHLRAGITVTSAAEELAGLFFYDDLHEVILVGTSSGGLVVQKLATMVRERIERLVFLDALVPVPGEHVRDIVQRPADAPPYEMSEFARGVSRADLERGLFAELDGKLKPWALERATAHPLGLSDQGPGELDAFWQQSWPATVIYCARSANPPHSHQRRTAERLDASWLEMDAGHYPMLTHPEQTAELLGVGPFS